MNRDEKPHFLGARSILNSETDPDALSWEQVLAGFAQELDEKGDPLGPLSKEELAKRIRITHLPQGENIAVLFFQEDDLNLAKGLIAKLEKRNNQIHFFQMDSSLKNLDSISGEIVALDASLILMPHPEDPRVREREPHREIESAARDRLRETVIAYYETPSLLLAGKTIEALDAETHRKKIRAIREHHSQVDRLRFDLVAEGQMLTTAMMARREGLLQSGESWAEAFSVVKIRGEEAVEVLHPMFEEEGTVVAVSPHHDDPEIAIAGKLRRLMVTGKYRGHLVVVTPGLGAVITGKDGREVTDREQKIAIREQETRNANERLELPRKRFSIAFEYLSFGEEENKREDGSRVISDQDRERMYEIIKEQYKNHKDQNRKGLFVVFLTDENDAHGAHEAALEVGLEAVKRISKEEKNTPILVVYYLSPWCDLFNTYVYLSVAEVQAKGASIPNPERMKETIPLGVANAIVATERGSLRAPAGTTPVRPAQLGGIVAERFNFVRCSPEGKRSRDKAVSIVIADSKAPKSDRMRRSL